MRIFIEDEKSEKIEVKLYHFFWQDLSIIIKKSFNVSQIHLRKFSSYEVFWSRNSATALSDSVAYRF